MADLVTGSPPEVLITDDGPVRIVTLNRPADLNAVNRPLHDRLGRIWAELADDRDARAVVLTGNGPAFSAGGDYEFMVQAQDPDERWRIIAEARRIIAEMLQFPLPVVAAVNGPAVGLGASLALMCDLVVMSETAHLADPHVNVGLVAGDGGAATWPAHVSLLLAKEFLLLGEEIPASRAAEIGLVNRVVSQDRVVSTALELAHRLAAKPAHALQDTKRALNLYLEQSMSSARNYALAAERYSMSDHDHTMFVQRTTRKRLKK